MKFEWWMFVIGAVLSWGVYVPVLHEGQAAMGGGKPSDGAIRAFLCVGLAYFVTAVVIPLIALYFGWVPGETLDFKNADGELKTRALTFASLGGIAGAAGALCIIFSMKVGGTPLYVPPLVFAGAPIVNAIVTVIWKWKPEYSHPDRLESLNITLPFQRGWLLFGAGLLLAAAGAGLVLYSKGSLDVAAKKLEQESRAKAAAAVLAQAPPPQTGIQAAPPEA